MDSGLRECIRGILVCHLIEIEEADKRGDYATRHKATYGAMLYAATLDYPIGFEIDPKDQERPVVGIIQLPTGQVSWHMPAAPTPWDGHTTEEKYERVREYVRLYDLAPKYIPLPGVTAGGDGE